MLDSLKSWTSLPALTDGLFPKRLPGKIFHAGDLRQLPDAKKLAVTNLYRNIHKDKDKVKHQAGPKCIQLEVWIGLVRMYRTG